jgi:predicted dienelactone hydrolase
LHPDRPFTQPGAWTDATERNRRDDLETLLAYALTHAPYKSTIDPDRIALMGHSLGGYTALGMAGAWRRWHDSRVKCVLALSPYIAPLLAIDRLEGVRVPVMYQTGTRDIAIAPALLDQGGYERTAGRKYLVVLQGAGHFAWTELNPEFQDTIGKYAVAFFDQELRGLDAPLLRGKAFGQVSDYRLAPSR